jgi:MraZ protein
MDAKGRFSLPAKHRKELPEHLLIAKAPDEKFPHLRIYSAEEYDEWVDSVFESLGGFKATDPKHDYLRSELRDNTEDAVFDSVGRISVSKDLRKYAFLDKTVVVRGADTHVQVWDAEQLEKYQKEFQSVNVFSMH